MTIKRKIFKFLNLMLLVFLIYNCGSEQSASQNNLQVISVCLGSTKSANLTGTQSVKLVVNTSPSCQSSGSNANSALNQAVPQSRDKLTATQLPLWTSSNPSCASVNPQYGYSTFLSINSTQPCSTVVTVEFNGQTSTLNFSIVPFPNAKYKISGTVSGLTGEGLVLQNNVSDDLSISADGLFEFSTPVANNSSYDVTVKTQPSNPDQICTVANGSGTVSGGNVTSVLVTCELTYTIGGNVGGLTGTGLVLQNNGGDDLSISANGSFTFSTKIANGTSYNVTVKTQPSGPTQLCTVANGSSTVSGGNVTSVSVTCVPAYTVGGTVSGLTGTGLVLQNNNSDDLPISANGAFTFPTGLINGALYKVSVKTQPSGPTQLCTVTNGTNTISGSNVNNIVVTCVAAYTVGGTVSGLTGTGLVLQNNNGDDLSISANGSFTFSTGVQDGGGYNVTVKTQPSGPTQLCTVTNGTNTISGSNVSNVSVTCALAYTIGGTVNGLTGIGLTLLNNDNGDILPISADGSFTFSTSLQDGDAYDVIVTGQPSSPEQICSVTNGKNVVSGSDVTNIVVDCVTTYAIGGTVTGLTGAGTLTLINNDNLDTVSISADGSFTFPTLVAAGAFYDVTVQTQPSGRLCNVANGSGGPVSDNVNTITVTCVTTGYTIGGTVSGLESGKSVELKNSANNETITITKNIPYVFPTALADGTPYTVSVVTQPSGQTCTPTNPTGTITGSNVKNINVTCT
jgi:hypothetical protein